MGERRACTSGCRTKATRQEKIITATAFCRRKSQGRAKYACLFIDRLPLPSTYQIQLRGCRHVYRRPDGFKAVGGILPTTVRLGQCDAFFKRTLGDADLGQDQVPLLPGRLDGIAFRKDNAAGIIESVGAFKPAPGLAESEFTHILDTFSLVSEETKARSAHRLSGPGCRRKLVTYYISNFRAKTGACGR